MENSIEDNTIGGSCAQNALTSQMLFQSISKVGAVLLHLGDMGKKIKEENSHENRVEPDEGEGQTTANDETSSLDEMTAVDNLLELGASCGQDTAKIPGAAKSETESVKNVEPIHEDATNGNEGVAEPTNDLRIIGDWYRDELEVSKMSSTANKSLNKLVDAKEENQLSDTLLLLATANDIDSLKLNDGTNFGAFKSVPPSEYSRVDSPNRTNRNHLVIDTSNKEIVSFHSSPGEMFGWTVSFEQILASILADPRLARFFEKETNLLVKMAEFQSRKVTESFSSFQNYGTTPT